MFPKMRIFMVSALAMLLSTSASSSNAGLVIEIGDIDELVPVFLMERNSQLPLHLPLLLSRDQFEVFLVPRTISLKPGALPWKVIEDVPLHEVKPGIWARRVYVKEVNLDGSFAWIISNQEGDVLWAESAPLDYEPYSSLFEKSVPDTASAAVAGDPASIAKLLDWDPTRLTLPTDIIAESQVSAYIDAMYEPASLPPLMPMEASSPVDPCRNFPKILHVSIPENGMVDVTVQHPSGYSGNIRLMMATDLNAEDWQVVAVTPTTSSPYEWVFEDVTVAGSSAQFFAVEPAANCIVSVTTVNTPDDDNDAPLGDPNKNSQSECSFVLAPNDTIVAAFWDTSDSLFGLGKALDLSGFQAFPGLFPRSTGWSVSTDCGTTFLDMGALAPNPPLVAAEGDVGDPVMAYNAATEEIFLLLNPSREPGYWGGFRLWKSSDLGSSFDLINTDVFSGALEQGDKPMIAIDSSIGALGRVYAAGTGTFDGNWGICIGSSDDGGDSFDVEFLDRGRGADIAIQPDGTVFVFYLWSTEDSEEDPSLGLQQSYHEIRYAYLPANESTWVKEQIVPVDPEKTNPSSTPNRLYSVEGNAMGKLKRSNSATADDYFVNNAFPRVAANPMNGNLIIAYGDLPIAGSNVDRGDIYLLEAIDQPIGVSWGSRIRISDGDTDTDQWLPDVAINPAGNHIFVGYYSREEDASANEWIRAYGATADISTGLEGASVATFPISQPFQTLFNGTIASTPPEDPCGYDHVWVQQNVCLDPEGNVISGITSLFDCRQDDENNVFSFTSPYIHFNADDYTWADCDNTYFYYTWCDRSGTFDECQQGAERRDADVMMAKIKF